jgi:hypothetical protein
MDIGCSLNSGPTQEHKEVMTSRLGSRVMTAETLLSHVQRTVCTGAKTEEEVGGIGLTAERHTLVESSAFH